MAIPTTKTKGRGTTFEFGASSADTEVGNLLTFGLPNGTKAKIPMTGNDDDYMVTAAGIPDYGDCQFTCLFTEDAYNDLLTEFASDNDDCYFQVTFPSTATATWQGYISALGATAQGPDGRWEVSFTVTANTAVSFTPSST